MLLKTLFSAFSLLFSVVSFTHASTVEKIRLENGLTVLIEPRSSVEAVSIYAYVKAGSALEGNYAGMGISHFLEHMLFKGTAKRKVGEIAKEVKALGGEINAHTSLDYTMYTLDVPKAALAQGIDIISDMLMNSTIDPLEVEKEREVIHGEMRLYQDRPGRVLNDLVFNTVFIQHSYRHPIIGYRKLFDQITREDIFQFYKSHYTPNNIILSVAGALDPKEAAELIKKSFDDFKPRAIVDRNLVPEPPQLSPRFKIQEYKTNLYRLSLSYQGVGLLDKDLYAMDVLAMALGQGESSRLYAHLFKNKKLVDNVSASNFTPYDRGLFEIEAQMNHGDWQAVVSEIKRVIEAVKAKGLTPAELEKTKRQVLTGFIFANQTSHGLAYRNAADEAMTGDVQFSKHYVKAVKSVRNEDIKRVAQQYLNEAQSSLVILTPLSEIAPKTTESQESKLSFEKIVLDNGLTLLLKEDHSNPTISLQLVMKAGVREESKELNGLATLTARLWSKATASMDAKTLALALESRGIGMDTFAGRNSIGLKMNFLSDDLDLSLKILSDLIKDPAFNPLILEEERKLMLSAIDARDDDLPSVTFKELNQTLFLSHPARLDPLGTKESVANIKREDIVDFYLRFAKAQNMVLSIVGDFNASQVAGILKNKLSVLKSQKLVLSEFQEEMPLSMRRKDLKMDKEQAMVAIGFQAPSISDKDRFTMEIIDAILGSGLSGRLFVKVRDQLGKAYTVGSSYVPGIDTGMFSAYVLTSPDKASSVQEILWREINSLTTTEVPTEELKAIKSYLKGSFALSLDTPSSLASMSSLDELYGLGFDFYARYASMIDAITGQDIMRVARQYLQQQKSAIVLTNAQEKD